jgi:Spy/CpxP family protein refolding chaperone
MDRLKLAAGVSILLIVGVLAGSLGTVVYYKKRVEEFEAGGPPVSERVQIVSRRFSDDLNLTNDQRAEIEKIVRESQEKIFSLGRRVFPEIEEINKQTFESIRDRLTDEQKDKLDKLVRRMKDIRDRFPRGQAHSQRAPDQHGGPKDVPKQMPPQWIPEHSPVPGSPDVKPFQKDYRWFIDPLKDRLDLSPEQEEKIRSLMEENEEVRGKCLEEFWRDLAEIQKAFEEDLSSILTAEQLERYRTAKEQGAAEAQMPEMYF